MVDQEDSTANSSNPDKGEVNMIEINQGTQSKSPAKKKEKTITQNVLHSSAAIARAEESE